MLDGSAESIQGSQQVRNHNLLTPLQKGGAGIGIALSVIVLIGSSGAVVIGGLTLLGSAGIAPTLLGGLAVLTTGGGIGLVAGGAVGVLIASGGGITLVVVLCKKKDRSVTDTKQDVIEVHHDLASVTDSDKVKDLPTIEATAVTTMAGFKKKVNDFCIRKDWKEGERLIFPITLKDEGATKYIVLEADNDGGERPEAGPGVVFYAKFDDLKSAKTTNISNRSYAHPHRSGSDKLYSIENTLFKDATGAWWQPTQWLG